VSARDQTAEQKTLAIILITAWRATKKDCADDSMIGNANSGSDFLLALSTFGFHVWTGDRLCVMGLISGPNGSASLDHRVGCKARTEYTRADSGRAVFAPCRSISRRVDKGHLV
jgi:hypothetical protein